MNTVYDLINNDAKEYNSNYLYLTTNNLNNSSCYLTNYSDFNFGPGYNLGFNSTDECN
jgi:hypothetical protein